MKASLEQGAVYHVSTIHRVSSSARSELLYASESLGHCDTALTTLRHPSRRSGIRMSKSNSFSCLSAGLLPRLFPGFSPGGTLFLPGSHQQYNHYKLHPSSGWRKGFISIFTNVGINAIFPLKITYSMVPVDSTGLFGLH